MAELLKDMFNQESVQNFASIIQKAYPNFQIEKFMGQVFDDNWENLELLGRGKKVGAVMGQLLPQDYKEALAVLDEIVDEASAVGFFGTIFPDFVSIFGLDDENWEISVVALGEYTKHFTSEFGVRPFILKNEEKMMNQMLVWSKDENEHVRRLASEGCRPLLPWAPGLPRLKKDPSLILPILENLKEDDSLYVRKSVANNLNDISKNHPEIVIEIAKKWFGDNKNTNWIVKHACRTLLKQANPAALEIFGFVDSESILLQQFNIDKTYLEIGQDLIFDFNITSTKQTKVRLEYAIEFVKANGKRNKKVFQISEASMKENEKKSHSKKHSFKNLSTRIHYPGIHSIILIINGKERGSIDFELIKENN